MEVDHRFDPGLPPGWEWVRYQGCIDDDRAEARDDGWAGDAQQRCFLLADAWNDAWNCAPDPTSPSGAHRCSPKLPLPPTLSREARFADRDVPVASALLQHVAVQAGAQHLAQRGREVDRRVQLHAGTVPSSENPPNLGFRNPAAELCKRRALLLRKWGPEEMPCVVRVAGNGPRRDKRDGLLDSEIPAGASLRREEEEEEDREEPNARARQAVRVVAVRVAAPRHPRQHQRERGIPLCEQRI